MACRGRQAGAGQVRAGGPLDRAAAVSLTTIQPVGADLQDRRAPERPA